MSVFKGCGGVTGGLWKTEEGEWGHEGMVRLGSFRGTGERATGLQQR